MCLAYHHVATMYVTDYIWKNIADAVLPPKVKTMLC